MAKIIIIVFLAALINGCATQRRCEKLYPPKLDSVVVQTTKIITRDTTIFVRLPAEVVQQTDTLKIVDGIVNMPKQRLDVKFAWSAVWIENSRIRHELHQKESVIAETIKGAQKTVIEEKIITVEKIKEVEKKLKPWQVALMWCGVLLIVLAVIGILLFFYKIKPR